MTNHHVGSKVIHGLSLYIFSSQKMDFTQKV